MAPATSLGYLHYPPPAVYMGNMHRIDRLSLASELPLMPLPLFSSSPQQYEQLMASSNTINDSLANQNQMVLMQLTHMYGLQLLSVDRLRSTQISRKFDRTFMSVLKDGLIASAIASKTPLWTDLPRSSLSILSRTGSSLPKE